MTDYPKILSTAAALSLITAPAQAQIESGTWRLAPETDLSTMLDCLEAADTTLISAHRGGPSPGLPENGLETMDAVLTAIPAVMEVDVAQSTDGVLYLMHDRTIDRTTNGTGSVADLAWSEIEPLFLRDSAGWVTPYKVPTLDAVLDWAKDRTVLQIDFKRTASYEDTIALIQSKDMADHVILIAYSIGAAARLHELAPEMMISLSINKPGDLVAATTAGIAKDRIAAFTGISTARPDLYAALDEEDVEVIFGTLGRPSTSLDGVFDRFGTDERYAELSAGGVDIIATDRPRAAAAALGEAGRLPVAGQCGVSGPTS